MIHQYCLTINPADSPAPGPLPLFVPGWPVRVMLGMEESPSLSASSGYLAFSSFSSFHSTSHCWQETAWSVSTHTYPHLHTTTDWLVHRFAHSQILNTEYNTQTRRHSDQVNTEAARMSSIHQVSGNPLRFAWTTSCDIYGEYTTDTGINIDNTLSRWR